jgi:hypothetical protein
LETSLTNSVNLTDHLTLFWLTLLANAASMIIVIGAAIRRPIWRYRIIGLIAICAFIAALHQVLSAQFTLPALALTILLVIAITVCALQNLYTLRKR